MRGIAQPRISRSDALKLCMRQTRKLYENVYSWEDIEVYFWFVREKVHNYEIWIYGMKIPMGGKMFRVGICNGALQEIQAAGCVSPATASTPLAGKTELNAESSHRVEVAKGSAPDCPRPNSDRIDSQ